MIEKIANFDKVKCIEIEPELQPWHSLTKCPVQKVGASSPERPTKLYIFMVTLIPILFRSCISGCDTHDKNIVTSLAICDTEAGVPVKQPKYMYL